VAQVAQVQLAKLSCIFRRDPGLLKYVRTHRSTLDTSKYKRIWVGPYELIEMSDELGDDVRRNGHHASSGLSFGRPHDEFRFWVDAWLDPP
jgi:hypothetical protein